MAFPGPLNGIRVIEVASFIAGPLTTRVLADLGADVIKVERPGSGDPMRAWGGDLYSPWFLANNRGKRSLCVNLKKPASREVVDALVRSADVLVENLRPGAGRSLGIGYTRLRDVNPRLVYCSLSGFGDSGPHANRAGYDTVGQAVSGMLSLLTDQSNPRPTGLALADAVTGLYGVIGVLGALLTRSTRGHGQRVATSLLEACLAFIGEPFAVYLQTGTIPDGSSRARAAQAYLVVCEDSKWLVLHLSSDERNWVRLAEAIGRAELLDDNRFAGRPARIENYEALREILQGVFRTRPQSAWLKELNNHDVPCAPLNTLPDALRHPQVRHLAVEEVLQHPKRGAIRLIRSPLRLQSSQADMTPPPVLGEHTVAILEELGFRPRDIERLRASGVL